VRASETVDLAENCLAAISQLILVEALHVTRWTGEFDLEAAFSVTQHQGRTDVARVPGAVARDGQIPVAVVRTRGGDGGLLERSETVVCESVETGNEGGDGGVPQVEGAVVFPIVEKLEALVLRKLVDEEQSEV
jgi:hypothetical protein